MSFWRKLRGWMWGRRSVPLWDGRLRAVPKTFEVNGAPGDVQGVTVFDPALKHFSRAYRRGDPEIADKEVRARWRRVRREAMDCVLLAIARSAWGEALVLRGSRTMEVWAEGFARAPGDLDYVMRAESNAAIEAVVDGLIRVVAAAPWPTEAAVDLQGIGVDEIWLYDRAPGRRVVFPWRGNEMPGGRVQVDVVVGERMASAPVRTEVALSPGGTVEIWAASREQSLAWKLMWLMGDAYPQGKDLYDAVLLAERGGVPTELLRRTILLGQDKAVAGWPEGVSMEEWGKAWEDFAQGPEGARWQLEQLMGMEVDWENFVIECPWVAGTGEEWKGRLARALGVGSS